MGPIELAFIALWAVFGIIGWVRGFFRELGMTFILFGTLLAVSMVDRSFGTRLTGLLGTTVFCGMVLAGTLMGYQGQTITYPAKDPPGIEGVIWGAMIGLFNGWLSIGSLWYFLDRFKYPLVDIQLPLSETAKLLISWLPFNVIPNEQRLYILAGGLLFLLLLRVIR